MTEYEQLSVMRQMGENARVTADQIRASVDYSWWDDSPLIGEMVRLLIDSKFFAEQVEEMWPGTVFVTVMPPRVAYLTGDPDHYRTVLQ